MEKELTANESLDIISNAIAQAKKNVVKGGSFQILLWGWIVTVANLGNYTLMKINYPVPYIVWLLILPGIIISVIHGYRKSKKARVITHMDTMYGHIWLAAFIVIMTTVVFMSKLDFHHNPVILGIAGMGMYTTGMLLRFRPITMGALILWIASVVSYNVPVIDQYLVGGIAIILGYLIPGYMLKRAER